MPFAVHTEKTGDHKIILDVCFIGMTKKIATSQQWLRQLCHRLKIITVTFAVLEKPINTERSISFPVLRVSDLHVMLQIFVVRIQKFPMHIEFQNLFELSEHERRCKGMTWTLDRGLLTWFN